MRHPSMSTRGTRFALAFAILLALALPRRVTCGYPGATCGHAGRRGTTCTDFEIEPMGFYLIEHLAHRNIGFAYSTGNDCQ
jgi:hypothetical protein